MMSMTGLRALAAVAEKGGLESAAEYLGRSQPAVSVALKQLADQVGAPLFEGKRKTKLTLVGEMVLAEARELLAHYDRSNAAIANFTGGGLGTCNLATVPSMAWTILPEAVMKMRRVVPSFRLQVRESDSRRVADAVTTGVVEFGFTSHNKPPPGLELTTLLEDRLDIVCHSRDDLTREKLPLPWSVLERRIFLANESYSGLADPVFQAIEQKADIRIRNVGSLFAMVNAGIGVTVLPRLCRQSTQSNLCFLPVADPKAFRRLSIVTLNKRSLLPASRRFLSIVLQIIAERADELGYKSAINKRSVARFEHR
jgi:DNA-binding transcriptional LysR family regulator